MSKVLKTISILEEDSKHATILVEVEEEDRRLRQTAQELAVRLKGVSLLPNL